MQTEEIIEEVIVSGLPWYGRLLSTEDWVVLAILATALTFGVLAWRQRQGKPWIGWMLVLTSIPAAFSFFAPYARDTSPLSALLTSDVPMYLMYLKLQIAGPYLSSIVLLLWKLRLLVPRPVARRTVLIAVGFLTLVVVPDLYLVVYLQDDWLFPEPTAYVFGLFAVASVSLTVLVLLNRISAPASVSSLLMMVFVVHSAVNLSAIWDERDSDIGVGFYTSLLAVAIFMAEIGYTVVRDWRADGYWVWEADRVH